MGTPRGVMMHGGRGGWSRKPGVDGGYRRDDGAWLDDFCSGVQALGGVDLLDDVQSPAVEREMVPCVQASAALQPEAAGWD